MSVQPTPNLGNGYGGLLDAAPLREAILRDAERLDREYGERSGLRRYPGLSTLALQTGIPERRLWGIVSGEVERAALDTADRYCCQTGRHLSELWPHLYQPEQIEADIEYVENDGADAQTREKRNARERWRRVNDAAYRAKERARYQRRHEREREARRQAAA